MSNYPRHDLQNQLLGRQLSVAFSVFGLLAVASATLFGIATCIYFAMVIYGALQGAPKVATIAGHALVASLILTGIGGVITVWLYLYLEKHIPPNFKEIDNLANQLAKP